MNNIQVGMRVVAITPKDEHCSHDIEWGKGVVVKTTPGPDGRTEVKFDSGSGGAFPNSCIRPEPGLGLASKPEIEELWYVVFSSGKKTGPFAWPELHQNVFGGQQDLNDYPVKIAFELVEGEKIWDRDEVGMVLFDSLYCHGLVDEREKPT